MPFYSTHTIERTHFPFHSNVSKMEESNLIGFQVSLAFSYCDRKKENPAKSLDRINGSACVNPDSPQFRYTSNNFQVIVHITKVIEIFYSPATCIITDCI